MKLQHLAGGYKLWVWNRKWKGSVASQQLFAKLELHEAHVPRAKINNTNAHAAVNVCRL